MGTVDEFDQIGRNSEHLLTGETDRGGHRMNDKNVDEDAGDDSTIDINRNSSCIRHDQRPGTADIFVQRRVFKTLAAIFCFTGMGLNVSLLGATIVHMERLFETSTQSMSLAYTASSLGYLVGGIACGFIYDRSNKELSFSIACILLSLTTVTSGFVDSLFAFSVCLGLQGLSMGFTEAAAQSYCVNLWLNHRLKDPLMQTLHAVWSLGAAVGPFIISFFLVDLPEKVEEMTATTDSFNWTSSGLSYEAASSFTNMSVTIYDASVTLNEATNAQFVTTTDESLTGPTYDELAKARYAYISVGIIILFLGIPFFIIYLTSCRSDKRQLCSFPCAHKQTPPAGRKKHKGCLGGIKINGLMFIFLASLFLFQVLYMCIEGVPMLYFASFSIKHLKWSVYESTLVMTVIFGTGCIGSLAGIPLSACMKPRTMLLVNLLLTVAGCAVLIFVDIFPAMMWVSSTLIGFGMSTTYAALVLWVSESIPVDGLVVSILVSGESVSCLVFPVAIGRLFDEHAAMWIIYILAAISIAHLLLYLAQIACVWKFRSHLIGSKNYCEQKSIASYRR